MTPWRLEVDLDTQNQLFYNTLSTNYKIVVFVCSCGETKFITATKDQEIKNKCEKCENDYFYNTSEIFLSIQNFFYNHTNIELQYKAEIEYKPTKTTANYFIEVPFSINFIEEKVMYKKITLYTYSFDNKSNIIQDYQIAYNDDIFEYLNNKLVEFIQQHPKAYNIPQYEKKIKYSLSMASFFLSFPYFKEFDFYYWQDVSLVYQENITVEKALVLVANNRKEKSIKKAIYENYLEQLSNGNRYYNKLINFFTKGIQDPNLVLKYIDLPLCCISWSTINTDNIMSLVPFLQQHYSDKQIIKLLEQIQTDKDQNFFIDLLNNYSNTQTILDEFAKPKCNLKALHDEFVKIYHSSYYKRIYGKTLSYTKTELKMQKNIDDYKIKLPHNGKELLLWADTLHNCLTGYFYQIEANITLVYGFYKNNTIIFAVEIVNNTIRQASAKYNQPLNQEQNSVLQKWYKSCFEDSQV